MDLGTEYLQTLAIRPALKTIGVWSENLESLLVGTVLVEDYLKRKHKTGVRRSAHESLFGISPVTHRRVWDRYIASEPDFASKVRGLASQHAFLVRPHAELCSNLAYASAIAAAIYLKTQKRLPQKSDPLEQAMFWRKHYHSSPKGSTQDFLDALTLQSYHAAA